MSYTLSALRPNTPAVRIIGAAVKNSSGDTIGDIHQLLFDKETGCVHLAILAVKSGINQLGAKHLAIPFRLFNINMERNSCNVNLPLKVADLDGSPSVINGKIEDALSEDYLSAIYSHFNCW